jgi:hypothetical protein
MEGVLYIHGNLGAMSLGLCKAYCQVLKKVKFIMHKRVRMGPQARPNMQLTDFLSGMGW